MTIEILLLSHFLKIQVSLSREKCVLFEILLIICPGGQTVRKGTDEMKLSSCK